MLKLIWLAQIQFDMHPDPVKIVMGFVWKEYLLKMVDCLVNFKVISKLATLWGYLAV